MIQALLRSQRGPARRTLMVALMIACSVFAALLWGRLKLVTGLPRSAYADPDQARVAPSSPGTENPGPSGGR